MHSTRVLEIPVSITATDAVRYFRITCDNRGWPGSRLEESKVVHRWAIIMPITNSARVLGMEVGEGIAEGLSESMELHSRLSRNSHNCFF